ncbi:MAG: small basic protein [Candidatus Omnitrophica bacterium]|nr:small basic protein [Candidatus Omnitrophota bacterium]
MSQHSSLKERGFGTRHRNVLKRSERIKKLKAEDRWKPESNAFGLPKVKSMKVKVKKVKEAKAEGAAGAAGTAAPAAGAPAAEAKPKAGK